jgi:hypothetical protein
MPGAPARGAASHADAQLQLWDAGGGVPAECDESGDRDGDLQLRERAAGYADGCQGPAGEVQLRRQEPDHAGAALCGAGGRGPVGGYLPAGELHLRYECGVLLLAGRLATRSYSVCALPPGGSTSRRTDFVEMYGYTQAGQVTV